MQTFSFYINAPFVNMRESPSLHSKVVSQAIFSEEIDIRRQEGEWSYIATPDAYLGWVTSCKIIALDKPYQGSLQVSRLAAHIYERRDIEYGPIETLPYGSKLHVLETSDSRWIQIALPNGKEYFIQKGDAGPEKILKDKNELIGFSQKFLGLPYTWGGRSSFGYDCSGFIQMLYHQIGWNLPRDAHQQACDMRFQSIPLDDLQPGDLIFFGKSRQKILHVGLYLQEDQFIHATAKENLPWLRISRLSDFEWSGHQNTSCPYRLARQLIMTQKISSPSL